MSSIIGRWVPAKEDSTGLWFIMEITGAAAGGKLPAVVVKSGIPDAETARYLCQQENVRKGLAERELADG